ncbi:MAG TPA: TonB family protein [Bacteroidales bacterium]|nr:TonB family protein [Bacteroidales bacterium]
MQLLQNNDLRKFPSEKKKGFVGTVIIHSGAIIILLIAGLSIPPIPPEEEGIIVNFGTDMTGMGFIEPSPSSSMEEAAPPPASPPPQAADDVAITEEEPLLTQNNEEAPEVKKVDPDAEKKRLERLEAEKRRREELEAERIRKEQEEIERQRIAAEQARIEAERKRQEDIMNRTRNALANAKNTGTNSTSEGVAGGEGNQGSLTGSVDSRNRGEGGGTGNDGISYSLAGRGVQKLPLPRYDYQGEGRVVVEVSVDRSGRVTNAVPGIKGSNTLDEYLLRVAREAALEARFDPKDDAPEIQKGTITYNFVLK